MLVPNIGAERVAAHTNQCPQVSSGAKGDDTNVATAQGRGLVSAHGNARGTSKERLANVLFNFLISGNFEYALHGCGEVSMCGCVGEPQVVLHVAESRMGLGHRDDR